MNQVSVASEGIAAPKVHLGFLDGLRALAALFVVFHHAYWHIDNGNLGFNGLFRGLRILYFGRDAVNLFIVISGFCLMLPVVRGDGTLRGGSLEFLRRRAWRILPTYYAALLFSLLLIATFIGQPSGTHWDISLPVTTESVVTHLVLLHDAYGEGASINHVLWSIAVEWRIYFFFPFFVVLWKKMGPLPAVFTSMIASLVLFKLSTHWLGPSLTWQYLGLFGLGCLGCGIAYAPELRVWRRAPWPWLLVASSIGVAIVSKVRFWHGELPPLVLIDYVVGVWAMCLLVHLSLRPQGTLHRVCSWKPLTFLGTFAYSIYLVHAPLQQLFWQEVLRPRHLSPQATFWGLIGATPLILLVSYGFFLVAERPFLSRRHKKANDAIAAQVGLTS